MAVNPYDLISSKRNIADSLMNLQQKQQEQRFQTGIQKGKMTEEFDIELKKKTKEMEEQLRKKRKKNIFEKALPILALGMGPIGAGVTSGLVSGYGASKGAKHAEKQAIKAKAAGALDKDWGKTFMGKGYRDYTQQTTSALDDMISQARKAGGLGNVLTTAATSGIGAYAMSQAGGGGEAELGKQGVFQKDFFKNMFAKPDIEKMTGDIMGEGASKFNVQDIVNTIAPGGDKSKFGNLLTGAFQGDEEGMNFLNMLLASFGNLQD